MIVNPKNAIAWLSLALASTCVSCSSGTGRLPVQGKVTFDAQPIDKGSILFIPLDGKSIKTGGPIVDGQFNIPAENGPIAGKHRVLCFWEKDTGQTYVDRDSGDTYPVRREGLPAVYQTDQSPLEIDFSPRETNYDFHIKSK